MNDFLDAINNDSDDDKSEEELGSDASEERYNELKKEEADVDGRSPAKQRYQELKDKAKKEMLENEQESEEEEEEVGEDGTDEEEFITY
ncbi:MAG: hypothetical protein ABEJ36_02380 [Candidatus Nanosalina sp.]